MVSKDFNIKALKAIPLLCSLPEDQLEELRPAIRVAKVGSGEAVVREGDRADRLFVLVSGEVQVVKNWLEPGAQTVDVMKSGAVFGEMALMGEDSVRSATVVTSEDCHFLTVDREGFKSVMLKNPAIAYALLVEAFRRLRQANELLALEQKEKTE